MLPALPSHSHKKNKRTKVSLELLLRKPAPCFLVYNQNPKPRVSPNPKLCQEYFTTATALAPSSNECMKTDTKFHKL